MLAEVPVIDIGGLVSVTATGGVTHAPPEDDMVAMILVYAPAHKPESVMLPLAPLVSVTGGWATPPRAYVTIKVVVP